MSHRSEATCPCGQPTSGATLCTTCRRTLELALVNIAAYCADLDTIRAKQAHYGTTATGSASREIPLPVDNRFTDPDQDHWRIQADTENTLTTWARVVAAELSIGHGPVCRLACLHVSCAHVRRSRPPADTVTSCARYLLGNAGYIAAAPYGDEMLDELGDLERRLRRIIDRPAERWYAGICSAHAAEGTCEAELYARSDRGDIRCPVCGTHHDIAARRDFLLNEAEHMLVTASEAARAVVVWSDYARGENRLVKRISAWRDRSRIQVRGHLTEMGVDRPLYRLGDVLDLLSADVTREAHTGDRSA